MFADSYARRDKKGFFKAVFAVQGIVLALLPLGLAVAHFLGRWGLATFVSPGLADYQYLLGPMVVSAILTALVLFYSMVLTVMRCMKGLIVANVCAIAVSALAVHRPVGAARHHLCSRSGPAGAAGDAGRRRAADGAPPLCGQRAAA